MKVRTPQEKKALSYAKDRRNVYGENDKASRKGVKRRRAHQHRSYRRAMNSIIGSIGKLDEEQVDHLAKSVARNSWKKYPDRPLGEVVAENIERRANRTARGKTMRKHVREMARTLKISVETNVDGRWIARALEYPKLTAVGDTPTAATESIRSLFSIAVRNSSGADVYTLIDGKVTKPQLEGAEGLD